MEQLRGVTLVVAIDSDCYKLQPEATSVSVQEVQELQCDHEEADTRMILHAKYIADTSRNAPVIIRSPDTDVFVIALGLSSEIGSSLYFHTGREDNVRTIDVCAVRQEVGEEISAAIIGFHCFTGCDSVSSFFGKGKQKALKLLMKHSSTLSEHFTSLGERSEVSEEMRDGLEEFVCLLYGQKEVKSVNEVRYLMLKTAIRAEQVMPPNKDALKKHILRANFQARIYKQSLIPYQNIPSPVGNGWKMEGSDLAIDWMDLAPAPESVLELAFCKCKSSKCQAPNADDSCCASLGIVCTDLCQCKKCDNMSPLVEGDSDAAEDIEDDSGEEDFFDFMG